MQAAGSRQEVEETEQDWGWSEEEIEEYQKSLSLKNWYLSPSIGGLLTLNVEAIPWHDDMKNEEASCSNHHPNPADCSCKGVASPCSPPRRLANGAQ